MSGESSVTEMQHEENLLSNLDSFELTFFFLAGGFFAFALAAAAVRFDVADRVADARLSTVGSRSLRLLRVVLRPAGNSLSCIFASMSTHTLH